MDRHGEEIFTQKKMMILGLPESVEIDGKEYPVFTDYRDWVQFELMLDDDDYTDEEKAMMMLDWYIDEMPESPQSALIALVTFFNGGKGIDQKSSKSGAGGKIYDYAHDSEMIYAAFRQAYNIDLSTAKLHWWAFRAMLSNLPDDTRMGYVMGIRALDTSDMDRHTRERYAKMKKLCEIGDRKPKPKTLKERDAAFLERLEKRKTRSS